MRSVLARLLVFAATAGAFSFGWQGVAAAPAPAPPVVPPDAVLLSRFQPVTVLHPAELFPPVAVDAFLADAQLEKRQPDASWSPVAQAPTLLPTADPPGCTTAAGSACWRLNIPSCTPAAGVAALTCYRDLERARPEPSVVYAAVLRRPRRIVLEYWYWYWYDFWSATAPPTDYVWQAHEGDWEVVAVVLTAGGRPLSAGYSQHSCGKVRAWRRVPKWRGTRHPVDFVALGTHANYFTPRPVQVDLRPQCYPPVGAAILRHYLVRVLDFTGRGKAFGPRLRGAVPSRLVLATSGSPPWMTFPGYWGEVNLFHAPAPIGTRVAGAAPRTPTHHDIWARPLATLRRWPRG